MKAIRFSDLLCELVVVDVLFKSNRYRKCWRNCFEEETRKMQKFIVTGNQSDEVFR